MKKAFTLIELLVVISIIVVLVGLTSAGVMMASKKARVQRAKTEVMTYLSAIRRFQSETGIYPTYSLEYGTFKREIFGKRLSRNKVYADGNAALVFGPYTEFKESNSKDDGSGQPVLIDPWGKAYRFLTPDKPGTSHPTGRETALDNGFPVVYSAGPDGDYSTVNDNIESWQ